MESVLHRIFAATVAIVLGTLAASEVVAEDVTSPAVTVATFDQRWERFVAESPGTEAHERAFGELVSAARELGIERAPTHAIVVLQQAAAARERGEVAVANGLEVMSEQLAPDLAEARFYHARVAWETAPWRVGDVADALVAGYRSGVASPTGRSIFSVWRFRVSGWALSLFALLLAVGLCVRHIGRLAHDVRLLLFRAPTLGQARAIVGLVVIGVPALAGSPALFVGLSVFAFAAYLGYRERLVALMALAVVMSAPVLEARHAAALLDASVHLARPMRAITGPCDDVCVARLESMGDEPVALLARAWVAYRRGGPDGRAHALELLAGLEPGGGVGASAATLRGNIAYVEGDYTDAELRYREAFEHAEDRRQRAVASYGLYRTYQQLDSRESAQSALRVALDEDSPHVNRYLDSTSRSQNLHLAISPVPAHAIAASVSEREAPGRDASGGLSAWYGSVPVRITQAVALVALASLAIGIGVRRRAIVSERCRECATPISPFVLQSAYDERTCVLCHQLSASADALTRDQLDARRERVERWREAAPKLALAANLAAPGLGALVSGKAFRGAFFLVMFAVAVALLVVQSPVERLPLSLGSVRGFGGQWQVAVLLLLLAYPGALVATALRSIGGEPSRAGGDGAEQNPEEAR
jgi:tetratricopeptide (TPR) repeat protein